MKTNPEDKTLVIDMTEQLNSLTEQDWKEIMNNAKAIVRATKQPKNKKIKHGRGGSNV